MTYHIKKFTTSSGLINWHLKPRIFAVNLFISGVKVIILPEGSVVISSLLELASV